MANDTSLSPMYLDTLGPISTNLLIINGIIPIASNATWSVILKDKNGKIIYSANNIIGVPSLPIKPFVVDGLTTDTFTASAVLVYFDNLS